MLLMLAVDSGLFRVTAATLLQAAANPQRLGAIGGLMVLHTWGQRLQHHPHVPYCPKSRPSGYSRLAEYFTLLARSNSASHRAVDADGFRPRVDQVPGSR